MNWRELIDTGIELDEVDNQAILKFNECVAMCDHKATREDFIRKCFDPDMVNEFCFYPMAYWGRLIEWAEDFEEGFDISYQYRLLRASYLLTHMDPDMIQFAERPELLDPDCEAPYFVKQVEMREVSGEEALMMRRMSNVEAALHEFNDIEAGFMFGEEDMGDLDELLDMITGETKIPFNF